MVTHHSSAAGLHDPGVALPGACGARRAALYLSSMDDGQMQSPALLACARQARQQGLRVVTVVAEEERASFGEQPWTGVGGERLRALVGRLGDGQFDVIVAHTGDTMITIGASTPVHQGEPA